MLTELRTRGVICSDPLGLLVVMVACGRGVLRRILLWLGAIAVGAGHVEDDLGGLGVFLLGDGGEGAEELVGDVGKDGGAAGGDFVLGEEEEQAREEVVDLGGGGEVVEVGGEGGGDFGGVGQVLGQASVGRTKIGVQVGGREAAAAAIGVEMDTTSGVVDEAGFRGRVGHGDFPFWGWIWKKHRATQKALKTGELRKKQFVS